ncbi:phosphoribosyltransferase [Sphingomonas carotinifaciens]
MQEFAPMPTPDLTPIEQARFVADTLAIAEQLAADTAWRADFIVGIGRGGLVPGTFLSHATGLPMLSVDYSSQEPAFSADLLVQLARRTAGGTRLVFVDDINDSGRTIRFIRAALADAGADMAAVRFATLIDNVTSTERVDYFAQRIDRTVFKNWFVFPWEAVAPAESVVEDAQAVPERLG